MQGESNISEGTNIVRSYRYIFVLCKFWKITDYHWIINVKVFSFMGTGRILVEHEQSLSNCSEISEGTKVSGGTNILGTPRYWFPNGFFTK